LRNNCTLSDKKEELILFPYIRNLVQAKKGQHTEIPGIGNITGLIDVMKEGHDIEGERFRKLTEITNHYTIPDDGCNTYEMTFKNLKDFELIFTGTLILRTTFYIHRQLTLKKS
jgi:regulator of cell morphogenesis and NO signaling